MKWIWLVLLVFMVVFFGRIFYVGLDHKDYVSTFKEQCEAKGGVAIKDRSKGWSSYHCFDKDIVITIESGSK